MKSSVCSAQSGTRGASGGMEGTEAGARARNAQGGRRVVVRMDVRGGNGGRCCQSTWEEGKGRASGERGDDEATAPREETQSLTRKCRRTGVAYRVPSAVARPGMRKLASCICHTYISRQRRRRRSAWLAICTILRCELAVIPILRTAPSPREAARATPASYVNKYQHRCLLVGQDKFKHVCVHDLNRWFMRWC